MANLTQLAEQLVNLTVKEVKELTDILNLMLLLQKKKLLSTLS